MQQLREHYERQDTEELRDIARKDLTEEARAVLHEVLAKRGVSPGEAQGERNEAIKREAAQAERNKSLGSLGARLLAFAIDVWGVGIALFVVLLPLRFASEEIHANVFGLLWLAYFFLRDSIPGQSVGKRLMGIRAVQVESGFSCTWSKSIWRNLRHVVFVLDAIFALGQRRMRLGDMVAGTVVVRASEARASA